MPGLNQTPPTLMMECTSVEVPATQRRRLPAAGFGDAVHPDLEFHRLRGRAGVAGPDLVVGAVLAQGHGTDLGAGLVADHPVGDVVVAVEVELLTQSGLHLIAEVAARRAKALLLDDPKPHHDGTKPRST